MPCQRKGCKVSLVKDGPCSQRERGASACACKDNWREQGGRGWPSPPLGGGVMGGTGCVCVHVCNFVNGGSIKIWAAATMRWSDAAVANLPGWRDPWIGDGRGYEEARAWQAEEEGRPSGLAECW